MIAVFLQKFDAEPAPIHTMAVNQPVRYLHHLDEVHLFAVGLLPGIFPHDLAPVGEKAFAISLADRRSALEDHLQKLPQLLSSRDDAFFGIEQMADERRFEPAIGS